MIPADEAGVDVRGVSLFTRSVGHGPDTVVLHGGPGAHHDYLLPQFDALATRRRLRYYDQRGGGRSPVPPDTPVGWREHVADLDALLDHWDLESATVLGYSWGALLALLYAVQHPGRIGRLALVSPAAATIEGRREFERRFAERMRAPEITGAREALRASSLRTEDPEAYRQRMFELSVAGYFANPERAHDLTPFRVTGRTQTAVWNGLADYDLRAELGTLRVPARVLHGRYDPIPIETARDTAQRLGAEFFEMESGHVPYVEDFERFVSLLDAFLPHA